MAIGSRGKPVVPAPDRSEGGWFGLKKAASLVFKVPGLRGTHAQLLVGAGYRWPDAIAESDPVDFAAGIMTFAATDAGKRILRDVNPPDIEKIKDWVSAAKLALAA